MIKTARFPFRPPRDVPVAHEYPALQAGRAVSLLSRVQCEIARALLPTAIGGVPSTHGVLRALGVRVDIPDGFSENQALQWRFFSLMERA